MYTIKVYHEGPDEQRSGEVMIRIDDYSDGYEWNEDEIWRAAISAVRREFKKTQDSEEDR